MNTPDGIELAAILGQMKALKVVIEVGLINNEEVADRLAQITEMLDVAIYGRR